MVPSLLNSSATLRTNRTSLRFTDHLEVEILFPSNRRGSRFREGVRFARGHTGGSDRAGVTLILVCEVLATSQSEDAAEGSEAGTWDSQGQTEALRPQFLLQLSPKVHTALHPSTGRSQQQPATWRAPAPSCAHKPAWPRTTSCEDLIRHWGCGCASAHQACSSGWGTLFSFLSGTSDHSAPISLLIGGGGRGAT